MLLQSALMCLAMNIYHEARSEPVAGRVAVAEVTLNRVESKYYPDNVCAVVYQKGKKACAFSWTCDGLSDTPYEKKEFDKAVRLARMVMLNKKNIEAVGKNVTHYHHKSVKPYWLTDVKKVKQVGSHIFYKIK
jgi:N-acetylmuramoyl-L-alanine amidase